MRSLREKPKYRHVKKYYKSSSQYWKERDRRKQVLQLQEQGLTQKQIAERLGITERTVKRDVAKIKPYYNRRIQHYKSQLPEEDKDKQVESYEGKSPREILHTLEEKFKAYESLGMLKNRQYTYHRLNFVLNFNDMVDGFPKLFTLPRGEVKFSFPLKISIFCMKDDRVVELGSISFSQNNPKFGNIW